MKNKLILCIILYIPLVFINAQKILGPFTFYPNNISSSIIAEIRIENQSANELDIIAAFDSNGNCAGAASLIKTESNATYVNLTIYGDELFTKKIDEGMEDKELFTFKLYNSISNKVIEYRSTNKVIWFSGWADLHGDLIHNFNYSDKVILNFCNQNNNCLDEENMGIEIQSIVPVPATDYVNIVFNSISNEHAQYEIYDISGKTIYSKKTNTFFGVNNLKINLNNFVSGTYFIKITGNQQGSATSNFIKK